MECPVDLISINENKARLVAFFVLLLGIVYLLTSLWLIMVFLLFDFFVRTFEWGRYSPLGFLSEAIIKQLKIKNKPVDRAPKKFAAGVGLIFTASILVASFFHQTPVVNGLVYILCLFAFLESFLGFCAGCYVYAAGKILCK